MPTGLPYELPIQTGLTVANGASKTFKIKHPNRVRLARLRVQQTDGATGNFTVDIFNAQVGDSPVLADKLYQVTPDGGITQTGAGYIDYDFTGENVVFVNQDADVFVNTGLGWRSQPSSSRNSMFSHYAMYVRITNPQGAPATFSLSLSSISVGRM